MADAEGDTTASEMSEGLQVELFHPDSDREPGDTNYQGYGFDVHPIVFPVALAVIVLFVAATLLLGDDAASVCTAISTGINDYFGSVPPFFAGNGIEADSAAAVLLWGGGLAALQTAAVSTGLPFAFILLLMCYTFISVSTTSTRSSNPRISKSRSARSTAWTTSR
jgi:choline-glycine betaine transporter